MCCRFWIPFHEIYGFAVRRLVREPSLAGVCVLTLALAIGANTAIFSELAIRVALGATRSEIVWLVLSRGLFLASAGVTIGLAASVALSRVLVGTLFGVSSLDPLTYVLAPALLFMVVVVASSLPALRATRVPAIAALKGE